MLELLNTLRRLLYTPFETRRGVKRSAPLDEQEFFASTKMRKLSRTYNDERFSSSSSDNSRRFTSSKKLSHNYPIITLDEDDEVPEIQDVSDKRKTVQHTSTPAHNGTKSSMNGHGASEYFGFGNSTNARKSINWTSALDSATNMLKRARDSFARTNNPPAKNSVIDLTLRLDEKMKYRELLEKTSPTTTTFNSSTDSYSKYYTPVGKYFSKENFHGRQMVDSCKARQDAVDSIDLTRSLAKRKSTSTAEAVIRVLDDFDNEAILIKDSDSDVEIMPTPPSPIPDFKVERVNSLKHVMDACEFSNRKWLEEQNEKLRQKRELKKERWQELEKCTRQLNRINKDIEQKCLEELVRDSLTIKDYYIIPELEKEGEVGFLPLTEQESMVTRALQAGKNQVVVSKFALNICGMDIATLNDNEWLNDNVINFYMNLMIERGKNPKYPTVHAFNTFFYPKLNKEGYSSIRRWTRRVDIFSYDIIVVPIHLGAHWCMAIVDFRDKSIRYYDSLIKNDNGASMKCLETLYKYLKSEHRDKKGEDYDMNGWQLERFSKEEIPQQSDHSACGVFSCTFAEFLTRDAKLTFGQKDVSYLRRKMVYEIVTGQLMIF